MRLWNRLAKIQSLSFVSRSKSLGPTGWIGRADGLVQVDIHASDCIRFIESGSWRTPEGKVFDFSNTYQWSLNLDCIRLEHLRFGAKRPVYLFDLVPASATHMVSGAPHVCSEDLYSATLNLGEKINLKWTVTGPKLDETIEYCYAEKQPTKL